MAKQTKNKNATPVQRAPKSDAKPIKVMLISALILALFTIFFGLKIDNKTLFQRLTSGQTSTSTSK